MKALQWLVAGAMICCLAGLAQAGETWKLMMDKDGIQTYSRSVPGSSLLEIKAVMVVDAPIENVGEMIRDVPGYTEWMPYCGGGDVLAGDRDDANIRVLLDLPWPVTDREIVLNAKVSYDLDHGRATIELTNKGDQYGVFDGKVIRIPLFKGRYTIEYITREKTGIIYQYTADFAGALPKPLVNAISKQFLFDNLTNLRNKVNSARYNEIGKNSPDRLLCQQVLEDRERLNAVVKARLGEFIKDRSFVEWASQEAHLYDLVTAGDGKALEVVLHAMGSEKAQEEAVRILVKELLEMKNSDPAAIAKVLDDEALIRAIQQGQSLDGQAPGRALQRLVRQG